MIARFSSLRGSLLEFEFAAVQVASESEVDKKSPFYAVLSHATLFVMSPRCFIMQGKRLWCFLEPRDPVPARL